MNRALGHQRPHRHAARVQDGGATVRRRISTGAARGGFPMSGPTQSDGPGALRDVASMQLGPLRARSTYFVRRMRDTLAACAWWGNVAIRARCCPRMSGGLLVLPTWHCWRGFSAERQRRHVPSHLPVATVRRIRVARLCHCRPAPRRPEAAGTYLLQSLPEDVRIHRVNPPAIDPSPRCVPYIDGGFVNMLATVSLARRAFHDDPPTVILATGPRFHNFVAAYYIARMFGRNGSSNTVTNGANARSTL